MAVKYAVANGNWAAGATWNGGVVPTSDDIVYCNGYMITANISNIVVKELHNDVNPNTNIGGGYVRFNVEGLIFTAEKIIVGATFWCDMRQQSLALIINADIYAEQSGGYVFSSEINASPARELYVSLNGNVYTDNGAVMTRRNGNNNLNISINGNIYNYGGGGFGGSLGYFTVNGTWILTYNISARSRMIYVSRLIAENCHIDSDVSVNGTIEYQGNYIGANPNLLTILNPDTFTWKDVTEPRSNPFIIVTDADMNNRQQYPPENEVKQGTEYVWGQKVGTYQAPPESVVLKDFVYDNGDKTGVLETTNLSQQLISRLENCATVETVQQLLVAHLDN